MIVLMVCLLIVTLALGYSVFILHASMQSPLLIVLGVCFIAMLTLLIISYMRSVCTDPGHPSPSLAGRYTGHELTLLKTESLRDNELKKRRRNLSLEQEVGMLNKTAYCFRCDLIKLPRTHHCNTCQRCIQRMDHHCPWIGNCVGRDNHKYFTLFLFYTTLTLLTVVLSIALDVGFGEHIINSMDDMCRYITYGVCICSGMLLLSIGFLLVTQLATIMQNITTLESFTKGIEDHNVFDKGSVWANMEVIFGQGCWLLPTQPLWEADQPSLY